MTGEMRPRAAAPSRRRRIRATATRRHALTLAVTEVAVVALLAGLVELALFYSGVPVAPPWEVVLFVVAAWVYIAAGTVAWLRRPANDMGLLMTAGGFIWLIAGLVNTPVPALQAAGAVMAIFPVAIVIHLLVAFPSGRLRTASERAVVIAGYLACLVLQAPTYLFAPAGPLQIADRPDLVDAGRQALRIGYFLVVLGVGLILVRRLRAATPAQRRVLAPLTVYGLIAAAAIPLGSVLVDLHILFPDRGVGLFVVQILLVTGVPIAFAIGVLRGGFARTADIDELGVWLGADDESGRPALLDALAAALGDNSVELRFRVPGDAGWVTADGMPAPAPTASTLRGVEKVERAGVTIGAVLYDATQQTRPEEVRSAARVIALALDRERLTVELRASRTRLVEASDAERRRIARDLHDGLQSRLVLLAIQAGLADDRSMRSGLDAAIEELRSLVDGVMPAELTERGLPAAVEGLTDRMPVAVTLEIDALEQRLPLAVESTGFFVVSEALVNAVKHAQASELIVSLHRDGGDRLRIEVGDNGVGGADRGNGIRSMTDRVEALGGRLLIDSAVGVGTHVRAELPCGS